MAVTNYLWDEDNIVLETDEADATLAEYTYEPEQYGNLISERRGGQTDQHHYDALGSTRLLTDETGQITDAFEYDAWGNELSRTGTTETPFRWVGELGYYFDTETGQYTIRIRTYGPFVARWTAPDPLGFVDGPNRLIYAQNSPLRAGDPSGLDSVFVTKGPYFTTIRIKGGCCLDESQIPVFTGGTLLEQYRARVGLLVGSVHDACQCVHRALYTIQKYWSKIRADHARAIQLGTPYKSLLQNRSFYENTLQTIYDACNKGTIEFACANATDRAECAKQGADLITWFGWFYSKDTPMRICPSFWKVARTVAKRELVHEVGRWYGSIKDDPSGTDSITDWDSIVTTLCDVEFGIYTAESENEDTTHRARKPTRTNRKWHGSRPSPPRGGSTYRPDPLP